MFSGQRELRLFVVIELDMIEARLDMTSFARLSTKSSRMDVFVTRHARGLRRHRRAPNFVAVLATILAMRASQRPARLLLVVEARLRKIDLLLVAACAFALSGDYRSMGIIMTTAAVTEVAFRDLEGLDVFAMTVDALRTSMRAGDRESRLVVVELRRSEVRDLAIAESVTDATIGEALICKRMRILTARPVIFWAAIMTRRALTS